MVAWASGPRAEALAQPVVATSRQRTKGHVGIPYVTTIRSTYRDREPSGIRDGWDTRRPTAGIRLTQAVKYGTGRRLERVEARTVISDLIEQPFAVHLERLNGTLRDRLNCLPHKTHGLAKEVATWDAWLRLVLFEQNWLHPRTAFRVPLPAVRDGHHYQQRTPAMPLNLTDHAWSWQELLPFRVEQW